MPRINDFHAVRINKIIYESLLRFKETSEFKFVSTNTFIETILSNFTKSGQICDEKSPLQISPWILERIQTICDAEKEIVSVFINRILREYLLKEQSPTAKIMDPSKLSNEQLQPPRLGFHSLLINGRQYVTADSHVHAPGQILSSPIKNKKTEDQTKRALLTQ